MEASSFFPLFFSNLTFLGQVNTLVLLSYMERLLPSVQVDAQHGCVQVHPGVV